MARGRIVIRNVPRSRDDEVLEWIALRCSGVGAHQIARRFGTRSETVKITTNAVKDADAAESGEDTRGAYW